MGVAGLAKLLLHKDNAVGGRQSIEASWPISSPRRPTIADPIGVDEHGISDVARQSEIEAVF